MVTLEFSGLQYEIQRASFRELLLLLLLLLLLISYNYFRKSEENNVDRYSYAFYSVIQWILELKCAASPIRSVEPWKKL